MDSLKKKVTETIDRNANAMFKDLAEIVRIPSIVGSEGEAQKWVFEKMQSFGLDVAAFEPNKEELLRHPSYTKVAWAYDGRPNVIGRLQGNPDANSLILNGHSDVVSPEPLSQWTKDPWGAEISDGKMYGRGTGDMKG